MSRIKSKNTAPEWLVRKYLHKNGLRYRLHKKELPGKPDIVLTKYKTVVFVHGCFFHVHECEKFKWPIGNKEFWEEKLRGNVARDLKNKEALEKSGWKVITVWECDLKSNRNSVILANLLKEIKD